MQLLKSGRFRLYDYGSPAANRARYGTPRAPDLAQGYGTLVGLPVDLVAGRQDGIIHHQDVMRHYEAMKAAGVQVRGVFEWVCMVVVGGRGAGAGCVCLCVVWWLVGVQVQWGAGAGGQLRM